VCVCVRGGYELEAAGGSPSSGAALRSFPWVYRGILNVDSRARAHLMPQRRLVRDSGSSEHYKCALGATRHQCSTTSTQPHINMLPKCSVMQHSTAHILQPAWVPYLSVPHSTICPLRRPLRDAGTRLTACEAHVRQLAAGVVLPLIQSRDLRRRPRR
jgi:hypothetical protein